MAGDSVPNSALVDAIKSLFGEVKSLGRKLVDLECRFVRAISDLAAQQAEQHAELMGAVGESCKPGML